MTLVVQRKRVPRIAVLAAWLAGAGLLFSGAPSRADAEAQLAVQATAEGLHITLPRDALAGGAILIVSSDPTEQTLEDDLRGFAADGLAIAMQVHQDTPFPVFLPRELFLDAVQGSKRFQVMLSPDAVVRRGKIGWMEMDVGNPPRISPEDLPEGAWAALRNFFPADEGAEGEARIVGAPTTLVRLPVPGDQAPDDEPVILLCLRYTVTAQERARTVAFALETPALASEAALFVWGDRRDDNEWLRSIPLPSNPINSRLDAWATRLGPDRSVAATVACDLSMDADSPATMLVFALNSHTERRGWRRDSIHVKRAPDILEWLDSDMIPIDQWIQVAGGDYAPRLRMNGIIAPPFFGPGAEFAEDYAGVEITMSASGIQLLHQASIEH